MAQISTPFWLERDYLLRLVGQTVSQVGSEVSAIAFPLLILALTHSPAQAGLAGALGTLPSILSLPAGALVDHWNRKRVMILCDAGRALILGSIPVIAALGYLTAWVLYPAIVMSAMLGVFFNLAATAALPHLVPREQLASAAAQDNVGYSVSVILGPPLGGFLLSIGRALPFLADAASYALSVGGLLLIRAEFQDGRGTAKPRLEIIEGLAWLWRHPFIRFLAFFGAGYALTFSALDLIVIVVAKQRLHASPAAIGLLFSLAGAGALTGSVLAAQLQKHFRFGQIVIPIAWLQALLFPLYALAPNLLLLGALSLVFFLIAPVYHVLQVSYRLVLVPDRLRGRVNGVFRLIVLSGPPVAFATAGACLQLLGPRVTVLIFTGWALALALLVSSNRAARLAPSVAGTRV